jgi:hypothetical protein
MPRLAALGACGCAPATQEPPCPCCRLLQGPSRGSNSGGGARDGRPALTRRPGHAQEHDNAPHPRHLPWLHHPRSPSSHRGAVHPPPACPSSRTLGPLVTGFSPHASTLLAAIWEGLQHLRPQRLRPLKSGPCWPYAGHCSADGAELAGAGDGSGGPEMGQL